jgi:maleylpyruvate isomerase
MTSTEEFTAACLASHRRLLATTAGIDEEVARRPSLLPGWTVGHVLTHIARNADGHVRRLEGALRGEDLDRYPGGSASRAADIEAGAGRPAAELVDDVARSAAALEATWARCAAAGWPNGELMASDNWPVTASASRRLREVEIHHSDLGLAYRPEDWPQAYVDWELPGAIEALAGRLAEPGDDRRLLAWLAGRAAAPEVHLRTWP